MMKKSIVLLFLGWFFTLFSFLWVLGNAYGRGHDGVFIPWYENIEIFYLAIIFTFTVYYFSWKILGRLGKMFFLIYLLSFVLLLSHFVLDFLGL